MSPASIPRAKMVLRTLTIPECEKIAQASLDFRTALEVKRFLRREIHKKFPGIEGVL
jgi:phosphoenolpyruvate-protein kinase (PTS system EI component)